MEMKPVNLKEDFFVANSLVCLGCLVDLDNEGFNSFHEKIFTVFMYTGNPTVEALYNALNDLYFDANI